MMYLQVQLPFNRNADHIDMECKWKGKKANFELQGIGLMNQVLFCYFAMVE